MRNITRYLLWLVVFSVPWGLIFSSQVGTITRLLGIVTIGFAVLTTLVEGRIRKPGIIFWLALMFTMSSVMSLLWTISRADSVEQVGTYIQVVGLVWVLREFVRTREDHYLLLLAFCLGSLVLTFDTLRNFSAGVQVQPGDIRYSASGTSPNYVGFTLAMTIPMAWHLFLHSRGLARAITGFCCFMAPIALLLTAGRGALIGGGVALSIIPLNLGRQPVLTWVRTAALLLVAAVAIGLFVPRQSWDRLLTAKQEFETGTIGGRAEIWNVGWQVFQQRPLLGSGAGTFAAAVEPIYERAAAHNMPVALLVEQGLVGFCLFAGLLVACAWTIVGLPPPERKLGAVLILTLLVFGMSGDSQSEKLTWVLFGLLDAQDGATTTRRHFSLAHVRATAANVLHSNARRRMRSVPANR